MHSRQRGAAHVNIMFFLLMLVLFLGALGFGYVQLGQVTAMEQRVAQLEQEKNQARGETLIYKHLVEELGTVVTDAGTYEGKTGFDYAQALGHQPAALENVPSAAKLKELLSSFGADLNVPDSQRGTVDKVLSYAKSEFDKAKGQITALEGQRTAALNESQTLRSQLDKLTAENQAQVTRLTNEHSELRSFIESTFREKDNVTLGLQNEVRTRREELQNAQAAHTAQMLEVRKEKDRLTAQNSAVTQRLKLINPPDVADGAVISSSQAAGLAWIDLGRKDMLQPGTVFRIKNNKGEQKAVGKVVRIQQDRAEIEISELADPFDPVAKGDQLFNDLYSPNVRRNIVLIGRFSYPLTKEVVKMQLEQLGNKVYDKPMPGVDLAIIGQDSINETGDGFVSVMETPEYKDIQFLGCEIITLNKIRDLLRLD
jgi:peptidoglycan hydrolase CwlO-like protein